MDGFGSCAEAMGGVAGRCDGIAGAVECQKSKGSLHLHFWCYAQQLHQFKSLSEIAAMLDKGLVNASDLKRFTQELCNEKYPLEEHLTQEVEELEQCWPCFKETNTTEETAGISWGECRPGRIPPFVWKDNGPDYSCLLYTSPSPRD